MILVTGATGHIGNTLVRALIQRNEKVRALILPDEDPISLRGLPVELVRGDVTDYSSLYAACEGIKIVYHIAGIISIGIGKRRLLQHVNVEGSRNVIRACKEQQVKRLIYTSSIHAFTELPDGQVITETKEFHPEQVVGNYAKSKAMATNLMLEAAQEGLDVVILHPTGVIGPYEFTPSHMGQLIRDFMNGKLYAYINGGYDFVDVRDIVEGLILACEKGRSGENYILSGQQITIQQILLYLEEITGIKAPTVRFPIWLAQATALLSELYYKLLRQKPLYTAYSIHTLRSNSQTTHEKATRELGYAPRPIQETLRDTVAWIKRQEVRGGFTHNEDIS
ncbi:SDR family oxidoreductase [Rubeoparvulum massiliense]|uniref:SDR family oxidoreductase n=1 Tax=Rubeoparvulum massiliense TaxID=1631346 RepID=UPI00065E319E|nr:SDR family oxidoreductase [Rubeoparvulum massiliense]